MQWREIKTLFSVNDNDDVRADDAPARLHPLADSPQQYNTVHALNELFLLDKHLNIAGMTVFGSGCRCLSRQTQESRL